MKLKNLQKQPSTTSFDEYGRKKKRLVYKKSLHNAEVQRQKLYKLRTTVTSPNASAEKRILISSG